MTNYGSTQNPTNITSEYLSELWNDICKKHWNYLETEESLEKIEERVKLETCLTDYLCLVPHDRKFLLPETNHVLKKSILYMQDFSAYKGCIGFESISQYANNLFTKPWRKEYKVIKMFSGFFQHEIRANLLDAERLFEAMGYKMLANQTLVLDGAICPDQVTNVSRDAMAAYVECQIIKQIYSGLTKLQLSCSWLDIYNFREHHVGTASQAIKLIAYSIQEKQYRKNVIGSSDNCYNNQQVLPLVSPAGYNACTVHPCSQCNKQQQMQQQQHYQIPTYMTSPSSTCSIHHGSKIQQIPMPPPPVQYGGGYAAATQIPHSKSLDQYDPNGILNAVNAPHRHSFDHHYEFGNGPKPPIPPPSFDCIDGSHAACNYNAFNNHPYNVSGNRFPLPYNLSSSLNNGGYAIPTATPNNGHLRNMSAGGGAGGYSVPNSNCYPVASVQNTQKMIHPDEFYTTRTSGYYSGIPGAVQQPQQDLLNKYPTNTTSIASQANVGQLIDLDTTSTTQATQQQQQPKPYPTSILKNKSSSSHINNSQHYPTTVAPTNKRYKDLLSGANNDLVPFDKASRNSDFDSYEDDLSKSTQKSSSHSQATKNQDGIGSYESWNYVFKNLEKQGYNKDLIGPEDDEELSGLDMDQLNLIDPPPPPIVERSTKTHVRNVSNSSNMMKGSGSHQQPPELPMKPVSKRSSSLTHHHHQHSNGNVINGSKMHHQPNGSVKNKSSPLLPSSTTSANNTSTHTTTIVNNINNEWSCRFCTFLNHESKRICEMCAKSRDFNLDANTKSSTATCV